MSKDWKDMTDDEFEVWSNGKLIDPIRVEIPKQINNIPAYDFGVVDDPVELYKAHLRKMDKLTKKAKKPKKTIKERAMDTLLKKIWQFLRDVLLQWIYPFAIYKKDANDKPIIDATTGKFEINWMATVIARVLSLVAATWGTLEFLGMSITEWVARVSQALGI
jgi:hypothetical protein